MVSLLPSTALPIMPFSIFCDPWAIVLLPAEPVLPFIDTGYNDMYSAARAAVESEGVLDRIELLEERLDNVSSRPPVSPSFVPEALRLISFSSLRHLGRAPPRTSSPAEEAYRDRGKWSSSFQAWRGSRLEELGTSV